jgi:alpha-galactosidase
MTSRRRRFWRISIALAFWAFPAWGVTPTADEMTATREWVEGRLGGAPTAPPFSFVYGGKPSGQLLPSWKTSTRATTLDGKRAERTIVWSDPVTHLQVRCVVVVYQDFPAVEWGLHLKNEGDADTPILEQIEPLDTPFAGDQDGFIIHHSLGESNSADSFAPVEKRLRPEDSAPFVLAPKGGRSSDGCMPFFNLQSRTGGTVIALGWSGQWEAGLRQIGGGVLNVRAGQQLTRLALHPGETIRTPRILLIFWRADDPLRGNNLFRQVMIAHHMPRRDGKPVYSPICASVNWTDPDGTYEGPHIRVLPALAQRSIEVFWSDMDPQQWYPGGFPGGTGTWEPDPAKYPRGLKPVGDAVQAAGLEYLLWFEPERVQAGTRIDKEHPEWLIPQAGSDTRLFKLGDPAARKWLTDYIDVQISAARLAWVRWDFNMEPLGYWRRNDPPDRQGITEIRHIEGLYAMWDDLRARHPGLVIDNCSSGGRRIDLETCSRGLPLWHSDMQCSGRPGLAADQLQNGALFRWVPMHGCGNFDYEPSYAFRSAMTAGNILAHGNARGHLDTADPDTADAVKRTVAIYKKVRPYMLGDFYPLFPHSKADDVWYGYQFDRPDQNVGMAVVFRRSKCAEPKASIRLRGIDAASRYEVTYEDNPDRIILGGARLALLPVEIASAPGSAILYYRAVK